MKIDGAQIPASGRKAGLTMYETEKCPLYVLTGVRIKRVNFREIYELFIVTNETVRNIRVSVLSGCQ